MVYDSYGICPRSLDSVYLHAHAILNSKENQIWIIYPYTSIDAKFDADFEFEVQILFLPTHSREKRVLKICVGGFEKFLLHCI